MNYQQRNSKKEPNETEETIIKHLANTSKTVEALKSVKTSTHHTPKSFELRGFLKQ